MNDNAKVPHQNIDLEPVHITYRLAGSLPVVVLKEIKNKHQRSKEDLELKSKQNPLFLRSGMHAKALFQLNARYELEIDEALHKIKSGPFHLMQPALAREIINSWKFLQEQTAVYVYAICVMGNHVHALVRSPTDKEEIDIGALMNRHKAHTARTCNKILGLTGTQFWEHFYFDRTVRTGKFTRVMWYVLNNPVEAGLVKHWEDWGGTYLNPDFDALFRTG